MAKSNIIVCFGDSNTEGGYRGGTAHTTILSNTMKGYQVVNAGKGGELTAEGVNRIGGVLETYQPKYVLLLEGTNDVNGGVTAETVASNLGAMAAIARRYGAIPIVSTLPPNTWFSGGAAVPAYNEAIADMAAKRNIELVDAYSLLIDDWQTLNTDGLHYNARGAKIVAAGFAEALGSVGEFIIGDRKSVV